VGETPDILAARETHKIKEITSIGNVQPAQRHLTIQGFSARMVKIANLWLLLACLLVGLPCTALAQQSEMPGSVPAVRSDLNNEAGETSMPDPPPAPVHHDTERGEIDLGLGFSYLRFRSSQFNANTFGTNTDFTYFLNAWVGVEGNISTGFGSQSSSSAMAKSIVYGAGIRVTAPHERYIRPWGHFLVGGIHMFPQTAFSNNAFATQLGGGADIRIRYWWLWLRVEGNYIHSQLYTQGQNNFQVASSMVYRF